MSTPKRKTVSILITRVAYGKKQRIYLSLDQKDLLVIILTKTLKQAKKL